jgi:5S rRNA maturation endonuclease (ribonuclease M5)/archaellum biogenesis ATPase FlaH
MTPMRFDEFLGRLKRVRRIGSGVSAQCPAHDDAHNSLSVAEGRGGVILIKCHAGCTTGDVLAALDLKFSDVMGDHGLDGKPVVAAEYDYRDEHGHLLYQVVRYEPKEFKQRRPDPANPGTWIWNLQGVRRVPYRLPELLQMSKGVIVYVVEGEKDADLLWSLGYPATTNSGGAASPWPDSSSEFFEGRQVVVLPDNDKPGLEHAKAVAQSLKRYRAAEVHVVTLPGLPEKGDVSDWFRRPDNTQKDFDQIIYEEFHIAQLDRQATEEDVAVQAAEAKERKFWTPADFLGDSSIREPEGFLYGTIFPRRTLGMIYGRQGSGKSWFAFYLGIQIALGRSVHRLSTRPGRVLFLSQEMTDSELKYRIRLLFDDEQAQVIGSRFACRWFDVFEFFGKSYKDNRSVNDFVAMCREVNSPDIVIVDSLARVHHGSENDNQQMGVVMDNLEFAARLANVCIIIIHHEGKPVDKDAPRRGGRGASRISDTVADIILVDCVDKQRRKSVIRFEKCRSIGGKSIPAPFLFTQEIDQSGRTIRKADGDVESCISFVVGDYDEEAEEKRARATAAEQDNQVVLDTVRNLVANGDERIIEGEKIERKDLLRAIADSLRWRDGKTDRAIKRNVLNGSLNKERRGKDTVMLWLPPEEN